MEKCSISKLTVVILILLILSPKAVLAEHKTTDFLDVPENSPYYLPVKFLREKGIVRGYGDGTFRPSQTVNRVEAISIIFNSAKNLPSEKLKEIQQFTLPVDTILNLAFPSETDISVKTPTMETPITLEKTGVMELVLPQGGILRAGRIYLDQEPTFTDVKPSTWYFSLIKRAISLDIAKGYPDGSFKPENPVSLVEALAMLFRTNRVPMSDPKSIQTDDLPKDVWPDVWFLPYADYALERTIVIPKTGNKIHPGDAMTRGELAALIYRYLRSHENVQFGKASWYRDGASKIKPRKHKDYTERFMTAAHKKYGFGTLIRVTNVENGKYVDVVVNDRGPFLPGRIIDLSKTAFAALEEPQRGVINVQVQVLEQP